MKTNSSKYSENSGFKVPEDYFSNLENDIMACLETTNLSDLKIEGTGFKAPENYFETIEDQVFEKLEQHDSGVVSIFKKEYIYYAAAVAAVFILMVGNYFPANQSEAVGWDDVEVSAMESYIEEGYEMGYIDLSSSEYSDFFVSGELVNDSDFDEVTSEAVFEYIDENIEDASYIME